MPTDDDAHTLQELFNTHEHVIPAIEQQHFSPMRPLSLRVDDATHAHLERLADRWGYSKSGLGARILVTALNEIELMEAALESKQGTTE